MNISLDGQNLPPLPSRAEVVALAQDSKFVRGFAHKLSDSSSYLLESEFTKHAIAFLNSHSATLRRCCDTQSQLEWVSEKLSEIQRELSEKILATGGSTENASLRAYRETTHKALNSLIKTSSLGPPLSTADVPDLETLWREAAALRTRNQNTIDSFAKAIESALEPFTLPAQSLLERIVMSKAISARATRLAEISGYYPRGLSPEAEAARAGMLRVSGDGESMNHVLSCYELSEIAAAGREAPELPQSSYFAELSNLKEQLSSSPRTARLGVLSQLKDLYASSGSTALAFYAALNCIGAGDTSHSTLFLGFESGEQLGTLHTLADTLRSIPNHEGMRSVLLQLYRIALRTGDPRGQAILTELKTKHLQSLEKSFAEALEHSTA
jgi:hypothetical protein